MDAGTEREAEKEALSAEADERIKRGAHWADWCFVADGFAVGRLKAMRAAGTNQPYGKAYTRYFGDWMADRPWAKNCDKTTRNHLLWVADHRTEIELWRDTLAQNDRAKMNHPTTLKRRYEAAHKVVADAPKKETKADALVRENTELWDKVKRLERSQKDGGSLFDLVNSPLPMIARIMAEQMGRTRLVSMQKEIAKEIARLNKLHKAQAG